jgi:energy-coupling factor transporter ATP-binding protein EcfA2
LWNELKNIMSTYPGSRWWSFDFHNHTPASNDHREKAIQPRDWLLAYMKTNVDCVAVTDHNCGDWIDSLKAEYASMCHEEPQSSDFRSLFIFPGVELTASDGIHILALFDVSESSAKIHVVKALAKCNDHVNNAESMCAESSVAICEHIRQHGGVPILAHAEEINGIFEGTVDSASGIFSPKHGGRVIDQVLAKCDAIESHNITHLAMQHFQSHAASKAIVDGSDAHILSKAGTRFVWVKMAEPSIEGLKLALLDPASSIIRPNGLPISAPPSAPNHRIVSVSVSQLYRRRQSPLIAHFSPWFNSVIGGRGSGKSTLLEVLRVGLSRDNELTQLGTESDVYRAFKRFRKVAGASDNSGMLRDDTEIVVNVEKTEATVTESYRYHWKGSGLQVFRLDEDGVWQNTQVCAEQAVSLFPIKIFSQKQIFEVADRPSALLSYIDAAPEVGFDEWTREHEALRGVVRELRAKERTLKTEIARKPPLENELKEVARKTLAYQQSTVAGQVKVFQENQAGKSSINGFIRQTSEAIISLENVIASGSPFEIIPVISVSDAHKEKVELQQISEGVKKQLTTQFSQIQQIVATMRASVNGISSQPVVSNVLTKIESSLAAYRAEVEKLASQGIGTAQQAERIGNSTAQVNLFPAIFGIPTPSQSHSHLRIPEKAFTSSSSSPKS